MKRQAKASRPVMCFPSTRCAVVGAVGISLPDASDGSSEGSLDRLFRGQEWRSVFATGAALGTVASEPGHHGRTV